MTSIREYTRRRKVWLDALRSGQFRQASRALHVKTGKGKKDGFCCLGVACKVLGDEVGLKAKNIGGLMNYVDPEAERRYDISLPHKLAEYLGFRKPNKDDSSDHYLGDFSRNVTIKVDVSGVEMNRSASNLAELNDDFDYSFEQIADFIEKNPAKIWKKGTYKIKAKKKKGA